MWVFGGWVLAAIGCTPTSSVEITDGDTLVVATEADVREMLPVVHASTWDAAIADLVGIRLFDADFDCALQHKPQLARSWSFRDGGRTVALTLRDDVRWQDGNPVTADDVRFAFEVAADPAVRSPKAEVVARLAPDARPRVLSPNSLEFTFQEAHDPAAMLSWLSSVGVLPRHLLDRVDRATLADHPLNRQAPIASGPWKVAEWIRGEKLQLLPNDFFREPASLRPHLSGVTFKVIPAYEDRIKAMAEGAVDMVIGVTVADAERLDEERDDVVIRRRGYRTLDFLAWNTRQNDGPHPHFADPAVRRALTATIDVDQVLQKRYTSEYTRLPYARPAVGTVTPALCGVSNETIVRIPFDLAAAKASFATLGFSDSNSDGWLDKDGAPFRFTLIVSDKNTRGVAVAGDVEANLEAAGIDVAVEVLDPTALRDRLHRGDFDAVLSSWSAALYLENDSPFASNSPANFTGYQNPEVDRLLEEIRINPGTAAATWLKLQAVVYQDQPFTFLYWIDEIVVIDARFQDTEIDLESPIHHISHWWVPAHRVRRP